MRDLAHRRKCPPHNRAQSHKSRRTTSPGLKAGFPTATQTHGRKDILVVSHPIKRDGTLGFNINASMNIGLYCDAIQHTVVIHNKLSLINFKNIQSESTIGRVGRGSLTVKRESFLAKENHRNAKERNTSDSSLSNVGSQMYASTKRYRNENERGLPALS